MTVGGLDRERLARIVKRERTRRGLSVREAARQAGVDRDTWTGVETASRHPQDAKAALMEPVVGMGPGSFDSILAGGEPTPIQMEKPPPLTEEQRTLRRAYESYKRDHSPEEALAWLKAEVEAINAAERDRPTG